MADTIWESGVDDGAYWVKVESTDDGYRGVLTVTRCHDEVTLLTKDVGLSYGARFGPDVDDVAEWQDTALKIIDADNPTQDNT